jgi:putative hydrolase of the HAD superfamily
MTPVRAISFDLFDTLVDLPLNALPRVSIAGRELPTTAGALHEAFARRHPIELETFATAMREVDREWRQAYWEQGRELPTPRRFELLLERLGVEDAVLPEILTGVHMGLLAGLVRTPSHHADVLAALAPRARLGVCSNFSWAPVCHALLERTRLRPHFEAVVISHEHGLRKPRPEIFASLLAALGTDAREAIHVGDNLEADVAGAAALGMRTVWITRCVADPEAALARHAGPHPTWIVRDLSELASLL